MREVRASLPPTTPAGEVDWPDLLDEGLVRRYFGPRAHLVTASLAARLAPHMPCAFPALVEPDWQLEIRPGSSVAARMRGIDAGFTLRRWDPAEQELFSGDHDIERLVRDTTAEPLTWNSNPVYLFF